MDMLQEYNHVNGNSSSDSETPRAPHPNAKVEIIKLDPATFDKQQRLFSQQKRPTSPRKPPAKRPRPNRPPNENGSKQEQKTEKASVSTTKPRAPFIPHSEFHLDTSFDYQNRSWTQPDANARTFADLETYTPYVPKRTKTTLEAHPGGVSVVRFAPPYGQLILSAGMDGVARIWKDGVQARSYHGHEKTVRDVDFDASGERFLTAGFDKTVKLWDVEEGRICGSFRTGGLPSCVRFTPRNRHEFLVGCGDRKILQIDLRDASNVVQEYDQHMGGVNSIAFVEDDRRFISSADDKVLRVWDYGIPVVIKYSMDNQIVVYSARNRFKLNTKKNFAGHMTAGYACGLTFSPDGRFVASGDGMGRVLFWDWKSSSILRRLQAHRGVCSAVDWHPTVPSFVVSCGWDGTVKLWD